MDLRIFNTPVSQSCSKSTPSGEASVAPFDAEPTKSPSSKCSSNFLASLAAPLSTLTTTSTPQPTLPSPPSVKPSNGLTPHQQAAAVMAKLGKPIRPLIRKEAKILFVGEAPGEQEAMFGVPFMGNSGQLLREMLASAEIDINKCSLTCVFLSRPDNNTFISWGGITLKEAREQSDPSRPFALIKANDKLYIPSLIVQSALERLREEIITVNPNIIVALGNTAMSALCNIAGIGKVRGTVHNCTLVPGVKVLPTYHPAAVFSQYDLRPIVEADFIKLAFEQKNSEFNYIRRALHIEPQTSDLAQWVTHLSTASHLAVDVETKNKQVTCIGFAPSKIEAFVIPFWSKRSPNLSYWPTFEDEKVAWQAVQTILNSDAIKIFQNGMYDIQYCLHHGWHVNRPFADTMLKHHALYPNLPKGLDFLGSIYTNERSWKKMRPRGGEEKKEA
jgi:uracil-DNA glycosylase